MANSFVRSLGARGRRGHYIESTEMSGWQGERLKWAVQALAMPANIQVTLLPHFVCKGDELALEWDEHFRAAPTQTWSEAQRVAAMALDQKLTDMSRDGPDYSDSLWFDDASLRDSPHWQTVRELAQVVLRAFGWPSEPPPRDPTDRGSVYVQG